jgi:hypothetical protein
MAMSIKEASQLPSDDNGNLQLCFPRLALQDSAAVLLLLHLTRQKNPDIPESPDETIRTVCEFPLPTNFEALPCAYNRS